MTTNIAKSFNKVLKGVRNLLLCAIIELTFYRTTKYFRDYGNQAEGCTTRFAPRVHMVLDARRAKAQHHHTRIFDRPNNEFEVLLLDYVQPRYNHVTIENNALYLTGLY